MQHRSRLAKRVHPFVDFAACTTALIFVHEDKALAHLALELDQDVLVSIVATMDMEYFAFEFDRDVLVSIDIAAEMAHSVLKLHGCVAPARSSPWPRSPS